jgi:threonine/homoserine/homoserine lactone efflux protein
VLLANPHAYALVRIVGGAVLAGLGVSTLLALRRGTAPSDGPAPASDRRGGYGLGLATNLGNPKAGVFAVSLLPQFVTTDGPVLLSSLALGALWATVTGCWYLLFTYAADRGRTLISRPAVHRWLQAATGCALLCLGGAVAAGI